MASHGLTSSSVRIVALGGLGEIGLNLMVIECAGRAIVIDCGVMFPDEPALGLGTYTPRWRGLERSHVAVEAVVLTHAHEDHIGALPHLLRRFNVPVYGTDITLAFTRRRLAEDGVRRRVDLRTIEPRNAFEARPVHGRADSRHAFDARTRSRWRFARRRESSFIAATSKSTTPVDGQLFDRERFAELGAEGVALLLSDSTNVERPGRSGSESSLKPVLRELTSRSPWQIFPVGLFVASASDSPGGRGLARVRTPRRSARARDGGERAAGSGDRTASIRAGDVRRAGRGRVSRRATAELPDQRQPGRAALGAGRICRRRASARAYRARRRGGAVVALHPRQRAHDQHAGESASTSRAPTSFTTRSRRCTFRGTPATTS